MKKTFVLIAIAALALAACTKEEPGKDAAPVKTILSIGADPTKTTIGDLSEGHRPMYWADGDQVRANGVISNALENVPAGSARMDFSFTESVTAPYNTVYPASIYKDANTVTLPHNAGDQVIPLGGVSQTTSMTLSPLTGVLQLKIKQPATEPDTDNIVLIEVSTASTRMSGDFSIEYSTGELTAAASPSGDDLKVQITGDWALSADETSFFIPVPAGSYNFEVKIVDKNGHFMTKATTSPKTFVKGIIQPLKVFDFVPTSSGGIEIDTPEKLIAFATAYNRGDYEAMGGNLIATVTADLAFNSTTSDAFNATGGIGTSNNGKGGTNYFNGVFNGGDHAISGLEATVPVFAFTGSNGIVKNLVLSSTCSYTVGTSSGSNHGALVGRNKGVVKDCTSAASIVINNIQDAGSSHQYYGGVVGYNPGGTIDGCTVTGDISCSQTGQTLTAESGKYVCIGGIGGYQSSDGGTINNCSFEGSITISDATTYGGITANKDNFFVAGILGRSEKCVITNCTAGIDGTTRTIDVRGSFVPSIGGILGWNASAASSEISGNKNYMSLSFASSGERANTTPCRIGGIAARTVASVSGCQNFGAIATSCNSTTLTLGGIVAESYGASVSDCINNVAGTITRSNADQNEGEANRYISIGGIVGRLSNAASDVTDCTNNAAVLSNTPGTSTNTTIDIGGIVGFAEKQIDISGSENNGAVENNTGSTAASFARMTIGGILGYGPIASTTIKHCDNKAQVYCNAQTNKAGRVSYSGGVAGLMGTFTAGVAGLEIDHCTNAARVWNRSYNNTVSPASSTPFGGGIVGAIIGTDASKASVHDCSTSGGDVVELRGYLGGIAGYAQAATVSDNTVAQALTGSNANSQGVGGIVGWAVGTSVSGCSNTGSINAVKNIGGLVCKLDGTSSITSCTLNGAALTKGTNAAATAAAVLVSDAASGATITNCGVKGTLDGSAITLSSNMITTNGGATVSGTYLIP